ncbi:MAG: UDP-glucose 4-epimerase GalE, partial [Terriglobales bacterium]
GDIRNRAAVGAALNGIDAVVHMAALAHIGESVVQPARYFDNNVGGTQCLLDAMVERGVRSFVFSSSCATYGVPERIPITENTPQVPVNPYGQSKLCCEFLTRSYGRAYGMRFAILRYFNAAGADESGEIGALHDPEMRLVPLAIRSALGWDRALQVFGNDFSTPDGTCIRDYVHVNDLAEAHLRALDEISAGRPELVANLGSGRGHSVLEIVNAVREVTGKNVPVEMVGRREGDPPVLVADIKRARELLTWQPRRDLSAIIATQASWMQNAREQGWDLAVHRLLATTADCADAQNGKR